MENDLKKYLNTSYLFANNVAYIEELYDAYLKDHNSVEKHWQDYFKQLLGNSTTETRLSDIRERFKNVDTTISSNISANESVETLHKQVAIEQLITAYRSYGHVHANLDPLALMVRPEVAVLKLGHYGFTQHDLDTVFDARTFRGLSQASLRDIHNALIRTYSETFAVEYMHISNDEQRKWLQQRIESVQAHPIFSPVAKKRILKCLIEAETLEKYLGAKYVGQTRFSLEGGGSLIPMLDELTQRSGMHGIKEIIIGMGHRGRISVLLNIVGKPFDSLLQEFEGKLVKPGYSGDVKYHIGSASDIKTPGGIVHLALTFNPSHLEIIDPVVVGSVRARQDSRAD
ncbi:MAG: 2-oxoglutarate dehydrogenase E1 component, partial [Gammaproteobacteria bacterium]